MPSLRMIISLTILLTTLLAMSPPVSATQNAASPVAIEVPNDLNLPGIESEILGTGTSANALSGIPRLRLERITLPAGASLPLHTATGPELLVAESGTPSITDSFGFTGQIATETGTFFETDAQYALSNPGAEMATVLRLGTSQGLDDPSATPVSAGVETVVLIDSSLDDPRISEPTLTIAQLTWHPNTEPQVLDHPSALGLIVTDGTLFAKSPSGFDGQLAPHTPVVFPTSTPLSAHAGEDGPAIALIVSILDGVTPIITAREPTPTPVPTATPTLAPSITPTPTFTLVPSETPIPTKTLVPTQTTVPTNTPVPTDTPTLTPSLTPTNSPTPLPTVDPNTPAGTILRNHETWRSNDSLLTVDIEPIEHWRGGDDCSGGNIDGPGVKVSLTYTNLSNQRQQVLLKRHLLQVSSDDGEIWPAKCSESDTDNPSILLANGETSTFVVGFQSPHGNASVVTAIVDVTHYGLISGAKWEFDWLQGKIDTASLGSEFSGIERLPGDTPPGSTLGNHATWRTANTILTLDAIPTEHWRGGDQCPGGNMDGPGVVIILTVGNLSPDRLDFVFDPSAISVVDDTGTPWAFRCVTGPDFQRVLLDPGWSTIYEIGFQSPLGNSSVTTVSVSLGPLAEVPSAAWRFDWVQGQVESTTALSTQSNGATTANTTSSTEAQTVTTLQTLPSSATLPNTIDTLVLSQSGSRSQSEITSTFPNPAEADALFTQWGWTSSNYEVFVAPEGGSGPNGIYEVDIGIHQLAGPGEAIEALKYFANARIQLLGLWEAPVDPIGNMSKALIGPSGDGGYEASVYVVVGSQVVRVTASSWNDYPLSDAVSIMRQVIQP